MNLWKYRFDMEKQVHFIPFNIEDKFPFQLEFIEKTVFKNNLSEHNNMILNLNEINGL